LVQYLKQGKSVAGKAETDRQIRGTVESIIRDIERRGDAAAAAGASVVVGYHRSADAAETFATGLPRASNDAEHAAMAAPVTDSAALHDLAARLDRKYGRCFSPRSSARTGFSCTRCSRENSSSATPSTTSAATPRAG
jgi:hypothetical protein